jgi:hypothetical protein
MSVSEEKIKHKISLVFVLVGTDVLFELCVHRSSLFITCSALYAFLIIVICIAFLTSEVVTDNSPLHYYEVDTHGTNNYKVTKP